MNAVVMLKPIVTEKSMQLATNGTYMFEVSRSANKLMVADAVAKQFKVEVKEVRISNLKGKTLRFRGKKGSRADKKRAFVSLKKGQKITIFEESK